MTSQTYDSVIIGAGWAGAVAARELAAKGHSVLVLEARDRVGGRAKTYIKGDVKVDVGCSWIHGYKEGNPARGIAKSLGVDAHLPKPAEGVIYGPEGPLSSDEASKLRSSLAAAQAAFKTPHPAPASSESLASALFSSSSPLFGSAKPPSDPSSQTVTATSPADPSSKDTGDAAASAGKPPSDQLAKDFARMLEVPLGLKLEKASLKWSGWETSTNYAGSDAAPEGGYEALVGKVLEDAKGKGTEVKLTTRAENIKDSEDGVTVSTADGQSFKARSVICTIPLAVLKRLPDAFFAPSLPKRMQETIAGTHVGILEKLLLQYDAAWWPNAETIGSYTFLPTVHSAPTENSSLEDIFASSTLICANFACPSLPGPSPTLLTYLSETPAVLLLKHDPRDVAQAYHNFLVSRLQPSSSTVPSGPTTSEMTNWLTDDLSLGATTTPSIVSEHGERSPMDFKELSRPVWGGKLGFAGEHTEMEHRGSVAGAVISGYREADRVARLLAM